jgi:fluoride exporter
MDRLLYVFLAGGLGSSVRYLVSEQSLRTFGPAFPFGTLIVNVVGCFAMSLVMFLAVETSQLSPTLRVALATGFIGGLTTYSAFNYETLKLVGSKAYGAAFANLAATTVLCVLAGFLGVLVARRLAV